MSFKFIVLWVALQLVGSYGQEVFHTCTLDNDDVCGGTASSGLRLANNVLSAVDTTYRITDVTSITKPTSSNELCNIPYTVDSKEYYHCRLVTSNYVCLNKNGQPSTCTLGKLYYLKVASNQQSYTSAKIPVPKSGSRNDLVKLSFSLYYLFECSGTNCPSVADSITVSVNNQEIGVLDHSNSVVERRWVQRSFEFETRDSEIQYVIKLNRPTSPIGTKNMLAIDQFELVTVGQAGSTTTKETSTDDQNEATTDSTSTTSPTTTTSPATTTDPVSQSVTTITVTESESTDASSSTTSKKIPSETTDITDSSSVTQFDSTPTTESNTSPTEEGDITSSSPSLSSTQTTDDINTDESTLSTESSTSSPVTTKPVDPTTTKKTTQSTQTQSQSTTSAASTVTTTSSDESHGNDEEPDSDLLVILLCVLLPVAFGAIAVGAVYYIRKKRTKKLAENWTKGADFLTDAYALGNVNDPDVNDKRELQV